MSADRDMSLLVRIKQMKSMIFFQKLLLRLGVPVEGITSLGKANGRTRVVHIVSWCQLLSGSRM